MPTHRSRPARPVGRGPKLALLLALLLGAEPLACGPSIDAGGLSATAKALVQTAQAASGPAGTALAGAPGTATVLEATLAAKATQLAPTLAAGGQQAGTALANFPSTATALAATLAVAATQLAPTENALATEAVNAAHGAATAAAQITPPALVDPVQASAAISAYAQQMLGISVSIITAGGLSDDIQHLIQLPSAGASAQAAAARVAAKSYGAILSNGAASVSYGSGNVSGDLTVDINAASLGAFSVDGGASPTNQADALALALKTYPALAGQSFISYPATQGFSWIAVGQVPGYNGTTQKPALVAQATLLSVVPAIVVQHALVSVVVGKGDFAGSIQ